MQRQAKHDPYRIDMSNAWHVGWWADVLGVSKEAIFDAVALVGNEVRAVEDYVSTRRKHEHRFF